VKKEYFEHQGWCQKANVAMQFGDYAFAMGASYHAAVLIREDRSLFLSYLTDVWKIAGLVLMGNDLAPKPFREENVTCGLDVVLKSARLLPEGDTLRGQLKACANDLNVLAKTQRPTVAAQRVSADAKALG